LRTRSRNRRGSAASASTSWPINIEVTESPSARAISDLVGFQVAQCVVDSGVSLVLSRGKQSAPLRIEGLFRLRLDGEWELDPSGDRSLLGPSLKLFGRAIESAKLLASGELEIVLTGDAWLLLYRGRDYEAWTLNLPGNVLVVSGTDGEISVFREPRTS